MRRDIPRLSRRSFLGAAACAAGAGMFGYGSLIEGRRPVVERVTCPLPLRHAGLDGLRVAVMSDFHHDDFTDQSLMSRAVEAANTLDPHLVILPGDFISKDLAGLDSLARHLVGLQPRLGIFGSLGNHDMSASASQTAARLAAAGVEILRNRAVPLKAPSGDRFLVAGLDSALRGRPNLDAALRGVPEATPVLLSWHEPDPFESLRDPRVLIQVSGHTHGGQVRAPGYGPIVLPRMGKKYPAGLYGSEERRLYVTRGIGSLGIPIRFCCPPEVTLLTLTASA